jgi:hypothetical protein
MRVSQIFSTGGGCDYGDHGNHHGGGDRYGHGSYGDGYGGRGYYESGYRRGRGRRDRDELLDVRLDHILDLSVL